MTATPQKTVQNPPQGFATVTPFLTAQGADKLIEFMKSSLGARQEFILLADDGTVHHALLAIGSSKIMIGDTMGQYPPQSAMLYLYVDDPDAAYDRAVKAGAISIAQPEDQFYGDRSGGVRDAFGNVWWFAKHVEDVGHDELKRRAADAYEQKKKSAA